MFEMPATMRGVVLTGHGGLDTLEYRTDIPTPRPGAGDVLIAVKSSSVNNTDINTRIGWYSKSIYKATSAAAIETTAKTDVTDATWSGAPLAFPRIQGADCFGEVVAVGEGVLRSRIGERVLVRTLMRSPVEFRPYECWTFGSEIDGGFADYAIAPTSDVFAIESDLDDRALGSIPCAFSTAESMLVRGGVSADDRVLILGASGGVGTAAIQLARLRGAEIIAVASSSKADAVAALGANHVTVRGKSLLDALGPRSVSVVIDLVGGDGFGELTNVLVRGGRYVTAGAIGGPIVSLDLRMLYLNDLTLYGATYQPDIVFENIVDYLRDGKLKPAIAATYKFSEIRAAQKKFLDKNFVGKIALVPD